MDKLKMKNRFKCLWDRICAPKDPEEYFNQVIELYSQPNRYYHTLTHISNCLDELVSTNSLVDYPEPIEFAIWYHDVIYDPKSKDNELKSSKLADEVCSENNLSGHFNLDVQYSILATRHITKPRSLHEKIIVDIDLAIFGKEEDEFNQYEENIRKEYLWVPNEIYNEARSLILQGFLDRDTIYSTSHFRKKYEEVARYNLNKSIERLNH